MIPQEVIEEVQQRADIVEVISRYVTLKKAGRNWKGLCPFHPDKNPSFVVSPEKQLFHCFGCGAGGNVFTFLMRYEKISFYEALKTLADSYGIELPSRPTGGRREHLFEINSLASEFFHRTLLSPREGRRAREYLLGRGIEPSLWEDYLLGFAPEGWDSLVRHLREKGVKMEDAEALGLVLQGREGSWYDRFRSRIIFPIRDLRGRVIGFGGRIIGKGEPKYLNSPETELYRKGNSLYGIFAAKDYIIKEGKAILVEGYFDLLTLAQRGVREAVATLGTALTSQQLRLIRRLGGRRGVLLFDGDDAGRKAALRAVETAAEEGFYVEVVLLPPGEDPDTYFRQHPPGEALQEATEGIEFYFEEKMRGYDLSRPEEKARAIEEVLPLFLRMGDPLRRDLYLKRLAERTGVQEEILLEKLRTLGTPSSILSPVKGDRHLSPEEVLLSLMIERPEFIPRVEGEGIVAEFSAPHLQEVAFWLLEAYRVQGKVPAELTEVLEEKGLSDRVFSTAFLWGEKEVEKAFQDCLCRIRLRKLREERRQVSEQIKKAEMEGDHGLMEALLMRKQLLVRQEEELKKKMSL